MGTRLREWRRRRLMTQRDLADASGVGAVTIARIEAGHAVPRFGTVRKLAAALKCEPEQLLAEDAPDTKRVA
jgi:transcriptional regulator with XRE-family HTH domain